jgi:hypothetical protein
MSDEKQKPRSQADIDLEQEIRAARKFSLADAIGRLAGPGMMKGVSPATYKQQAEATIESFLERHLQYAGGELSILLRRVSQSDLLLANLAEPLVVLAEYVRSVLDSEYRLRELVRETDAEWGRVYGERPFFEKEGSPAHADDPYTVESVRGVLTQHLDKLSGR